MTDCNKCAAGKKNENNGSTSSSACVDCGVNTKAEKAGSIECVDCDAGTLSVNEGSAKCQSCEDGKYGDVVGEDCKNCDVGQYRTASMVVKTTCVTCPVGYTQNEKGQTSW